jgi:hypothetical protein
LFGYLGTADVYLDNNKAVDLTHANVLPYYVTLFLGYERQTYISTALNI